jgi:RimJ/RimL family protein N-acetyltransferase
MGLVVPVYACGRLIRFPSACFSTFFLRRSGRSAIMTKMRIPLESRRCLLRPFIADDLDWLTDLFADREVSRFLWECTESLDKARRDAEAIIFVDLHSRPFGHWAIQDKNSGVIHGWTELSKLRPWSGPSDEIAVSYVLRRSSWGQGFATEAADRLVQYAFERIGLRRVMAVIIAGNTASRHVLEKIGMHFQSSGSFDGKQLQYFRIDGLLDDQRRVRDSSA